MVGGWVATMKGKSSPSMELEFTNALLLACHIQPSNTTNSQPCIIHSQVPPACFSLPVFGLHQALKCFGGRFSPLFVMPLERRRKGSCVVPCCLSAPRTPPLRQTMHVPRLSIFCVRKFPRLCHIANAQVPHISLSAGDPNLR